MTCGRYIEDEIAEYEDSEKYQRLLEELWADQADFSVELYAPDAIVDRDAVHRYVRRFVQDEERSRYKEVIRSDKDGSLAHMDNRQWIDTFKQKAIRKGWQER